VRYLTSLYVTDHRARVSSSQGSLLVFGGDGKRTRVPMSVLEAIVLVGHAQVTNDALAECVRRHIRVSSLSRAGRIRFTVGGATSGNVHLRLAQFEAVQNANLRIGVARAMVAGKLQNSRRMLKRWSWDASTLERRHLENLADAIAERIAKVAGTEDGDRLRGIEGAGTRLYFQGLGHHLDASGVSLPFQRRTRRPPRDPVNSLLSFTYGLLTTEVTGALETVGLDPQLGFLHGVRPGRPSLALDILEELRPSIADRFVVGLLCRRRLSTRDFVVTAGGACYLRDASRQLLLDAYEEYKSEEIRHPLIEQRVQRGMIASVQAVLLARHLRGDLPAYPPFVLSD